MEIKEIWKTIEGYENYQISNLGKVKSLNYNHTGKERILKQNIIKNGYCYVALYKEGKLKLFRVHRLVATAFLPNPQNLPIINHKDENKTNNCISNLEFCTQKYNINYGKHNERISKALKGKKKSQEHKEKMSKANKGKILSQETKDKISIALKGKKHTPKTKDKISKAHKGKPKLALSKPILQFNREGTKILGKFNSAKQAERELNIFATSITQCCKGKLKSAGKYKWKYLSDYINEQIPYLNELKAYRNRLYDILKKASN